MAQVHLEDHRMSMYMSLLWFGNRTMCIAIISEAANVCHVYQIEFYLWLFGTNHLHQSSSLLSSPDGISQRGTRNEKFDKSQSSVEIKTHSAMSSDWISSTSKILLLRKPSQRQCCLCWDTLFTIILTHVDVSLKNLKLLHQSYICLHSWIPDSLTLLRFSNIDIKRSECPFHDHTNQIW